MESENDFNLHNLFMGHCLLTPVSKEGIAWADDYLVGDITTMGNGIVVENRYLEDIIEGIEEDGLKIGFNL